MIAARWTIAALTASLLTGATAGSLYVAQTDGDSTARDASIRAVDSGAPGSTDEDDLPPEGVETIPPVTETPAPPTNHTSPDTHASTTVEIDGVQGADGVETEREMEMENTVAAVRAEAGSIQAIRGIEGIDLVTLENLELVLRMQDRPQENENMGGASTAARLLSTEAPEEFPELPDERDIHLEWELEGS